MKIFRFGLLDSEVTNAVLSWAVICILGVVGLEHVSSGEVLLAGLAALVVLVALVPPVVASDPRTMVGWEVLAVAAVPVLARSLGYLGEYGAYVSIATLALVIAAELDTFTAIGMTSRFAVVFVVVVTMAVAGLWTIVQFTADNYLGTSVLPDQTELMLNLIAATAIGITAGLVYGLFVYRNTAADGTESTAAAAETGSPSGGEGDQESVPEGDDDPNPLARRVTRVLQLAVVALSAYGLIAGYYDLVVNGTLAFGLTLVPGMIERRYDYRIDSRLVLWIALAAVLHGIGFLGPYDAETGILSMYDHLTHMTSAAFVAGIGYAFLAALDYRATEINFPDEVRAFFTVVFILATGVAWEILEFAAGPIGSALVGEEILTQYGIDDIILDIFFNTVASILVALWGLGYFDDFVRIFADQFGRVGGS